MSKILHLSKWQSDIVTYIYSDWHRRLRFAPWRECRGWKPMRRVQPKKSIFNSGAKSRRYCDVLLSRRNQVNVIHRRKERIE